MLLVAVTFADGRWRPSVEPYRKMLYLPWSRIPYPHCPFNVTLRDGIEYEIRNPEACACEPWFGYRDYFHIHATIHLNILTIDSASHEGQLWVTQ